MKYRFDKSNLWNKVRGLVAPIARLVQRLHSQNPSPTPQPKPQPAPQPQPNPTPAPQPTPVAVSGFPVAPNTLVFVTHDMVARDLNGRVAGGEPETNKCLSDEKIVVTPQLEALMRAVIRLYNPTMDSNAFEHAWQSLFASNRAFSNKSGWDSSEFKLENLVCGGATLRAITGVPYRAAGDNWLDVHALDPENLPAIPTRIEQIDPTLFFFPVIAMQNISGQFQADPFPQFGGRCPVPFVGKGGRNAIRVAKLLPVNSVQHPFLPPHYDIVPQS